jgi:hypothetical protein
MPGAGNPINPKAAAHAVLAAYTAELDTLVVLPLRQGIVPGGQLAYDGEQLTVTFVGVTRGQPNYPQTIAATPYTVLFFYEFEVVLLRKITTASGRGSHGGIPTAGELESDFDDAISADAQALFSASQAIHAGYRIVPSGVPFLYGPLNSVGPEGGLAGSRLTVSFEVGMEPNGVY